MLDQSRIGAFSRCRADRPNVSGGMCGGTKAKPLALLLAADGFALSVTLQFQKSSCLRACIPLICLKPRPLEWRIIFRNDVIQVPVSFCAAVEDRTFLRFVPTDHAWNRLGDESQIISELGSCLRIIECEPETPRLVPKELEEDRIFDLWRVAQDHIWRAWMVETDPANLQPKLRPLNRKVAEFIRANTPAEIDSARITQALDVVESPWPWREEMMLREWIEEETRTGGAKAAYLIDKILESGLEPFREPPTLAPIRMDEIELVCWMALSPVG